MLEYTQTGNGSDPFLQREVNRMSIKEIMFKEIEREVKRRGGDGEAVAEAYGELYAAHDIRMCEWLARLFDPEIGGFYYSNSGRDNEYIELNGNRYATGPDIESTYQALSLMKNAGMIEKFSDIPARMAEKIRDFTCSLLDPDDGYIYHPQWKNKIADARRGRDLMWANGIASGLGFTMPYPTAYERLSTGAANPEKREEMLKNMPEHLRSEAAFLRYLEKMDWDAETGLGAYGAGNTLAAQASMIAAAGLHEVGCRFLDSIQNKETGIWGRQGGYAAVNAILKITAFYGSRAIPNAEKVAMASMDAITSKERNNTVCYQYNTWFAISNVKNNLLKAGGEENEKTVQRIDAELLRRAPEGIRATTEKSKPFRCGDGSYSYFWDKTCPTSQSAPVAPDGVKEGDINASTINGQGTLNYSLEALSLRSFAPPLFGKEGYERFLSALKKV